MFPVLSADGAVLCFLSVSGYCMDEQMSMQKMRHFARKYDLQLEKLKEVYQESVRTDAPADRRTSGADCAALQYVCAAAPGAVAAAAKGALNRSGKAVC